MTGTGHQPILDELVTWSTSVDHHADLVEARTAYSEQSGEVFEDERQLESRMKAFLEYYVCDRVAPWLARTPARARYELALHEEGPDRALAFRAWTETIHGIFEVRALSRGSARVRHLYSGIDFDVNERRQIVGLARGDILEARIVPDGDDLAFSSSYCWHPRAAAGLIRAEVRRRLAQPSIPGEQGLVWDCALRALKSERYRQIAVEKIYDFGPRRISGTDQGFGP